MVHTTLFEISCNGSFFLTKAHRSTIVFQFLYSFSDSDESALELRVTELLDLMKEAAVLREQKVYSTPDHSNSKAFSRRKYVFTVKPV